MEIEGKESSESGSPGRNSDSESPPSSGGPYGGHVGGYGGRGLPEVMSMAVDMSMGKSKGMINSSTVTVGGGVIGGGTVIGGGIIGSVGVMGGSGNGELTMSGKKKRGRPRKYDGDGKLRVGSPPGAAVQSPLLPGFTLSTPPSYEYSSGSKRGRGRPQVSGNWQILASLGELLANTAGGDFTPHVVTVNTGEDVVGEIFTLSRKGPGGICVLSANGSVSNVTFRQPGLSGVLLTYKGRFEILTLRGSFTISATAKIKRKTGGLSVSLASPDGRVIGGGVAGLLMAANPIQIVVGSFGPNVLKMQKRKHHSEPRITPPVQCAPATVTAAIPISQAAPKSNIYRMPTSQLPIQIWGEADNSLSNKENPNSALTDTADWNSSGPSSDHQRLSPDMNISVPVDEH